MPTGAAKPVRGCVAAAWAVRDALSNASSRRRRIASSRPAHRHEHRHERSHERIATGMFAHTGG
jgi:hypothetical protein